MARIEDVKTRNAAWESSSAIDIDAAKRSRSPKEACEEARKAFDEGKTRPLEFRRRQLKGLVRFLEDESETIEDAIYKDLRKHKQESSCCEIEVVANDCRHTIIDLKKWALPEKPEKRFVNLVDGVFIYKDPYGVVLIIGAWNYPILLTLGPLVGAIAAGNTVILKPSELSPASANVLANVLPKYLDPQCYQIILGGVEETTELLKEKFDYIFFTGSTQVGKIVHQAATKYLTPTTLELGGKSPVYLDESADMEKATRRIIWGKFLNSGQTCISPDYLLCSEAVQEKFLQEANKVITEFYGSDPKSSSSLSKIVNERHFQRLINLIKPENVALGGKFNPIERIISPTILINVDPMDPVMQEEIFGPILPIINVEDVEEAIQFINAREKPLALYLFSKSNKVQEAFLTRTTSGGAVVNDTISHVITEGLPFGGVGLSGMGSYHGQEGFNTFSHRKSVLTKGFAGSVEMVMSIRYPPYSDAKKNMMNMLLRKRSGIPMGWLKGIFIFALGIGFAYGVQYVCKIMKGEEK